MHLKTYILVSSAPQQSIPANAVFFSQEVVLTLVVFCGTVLSNVLGWMATRAVSSAEKRIDQNALLLSELQKQQYALERKVAEQYVNRDEFTHKITLLDAHIEKLGDRVNQQTVLLKSIEAALTERFVSRGE